MGKVDPNEAPPGYVAVDDSNGEVGCSLCSFDFKSKECLSAPCSGSRRKDECYVYFIKRDGKATASWPYDSEGTPV